VTPEQIIVFVAQEQGLFVAEIIGKRGERRRLPEGHPIQDALRMCVWLMRNTKLVVPEPTSSHGRKGRKALTGGGPLLRPMKWTSIAEALRRDPTVCRENYSRFRARVRSDHRLETRLDNMLARLAHGDSPKPAAAPAEHARSGD